VSSTVIGEKTQSLHLKVRIDVGLVLGG
jgi:hypothetical protein